MKKSLILGALFMVSYQYASAGVCTPKKDVSDGQVALFLATQMNDFKGVEKLIAEECINPSIPFDGGYGAYLTHSKEMFDVYTKYGFNYLKAKESSFKDANYLMQTTIRKCEIEKDGFFTQEDRERARKIMVKYNLKYELNDSYAKEFIRRTDEFAIRFASSVPIDFLSNTDVRGANPLHYAISFNKLDLALVLAKRNPELWEKFDKNGFTPMASLIKETTNEAKIIELYKTIPAEVWKKAAINLGWVKLNTIQAQIVMGREGILKRVMPKEVVDLEKNKIKLDENAVKAIKNSTLVEILKP